MIGRNLLSVMAAVRKGIVTIFDYERPRLEGFTVTVPLRSESDHLYLFVLELSADGSGAKDLAMTQSPMPSSGTGGWVIFIHRAWVFYASETALVSYSRKVSRTAMFAPCGRFNSLLTPKQSTTRSTGHSSCARGT